MDTRTDPMNLSETDDPDVIRARIEETRANMSETVDHIQDKLSPEHIKQQVQESVREATIGRVEQMANTATHKARNWRHNMVETVKQNPVPAALAGFGLAWLFMAGSNDEDERAGYAYTTRDSRSPGTYSYAAQPPYQEETGPLREAKGRVTETARHLQEEASEAAHEVRDQAGQLVHQAQQQAEEWREEAQYQVRRARSGFEQMLTENPLAVAAAAVALGAAVGMAVPGTQQENELMGETRDRLVERAQTTAQETMEKVKHVAEEATTAAKEEAKREAERQDLGKPSGQPFREGQ